MSIDVLQEKIRKTKNPSVVVFEALPDLVPPELLETASVQQAVETLCMQLLAELKSYVPAVRFGFSSFALLGTDGLTCLSRLLQEAKNQGYYVLLDAPESLSVAAAQNSAAVLGAEDTPYPCDGLVGSAYLGSDIFKEYLPLCKQGKSFFPIVRTANKSAAELQDLLTGGRLVHTAAADIVNRQGESMIGKFGYSQVGVVAAASSADSLRALRAKYPKLFLLLDGYDYPNANAKNCSFAFDKLGHGAAACACASVIGAWKDPESGEYTAAAVEAVLRMRKNLTRYVSIL